MKTKFYEFGQNNSGGSFDVDENVCHRVVIEANDEEHAKAIFDPMILNQSGSCDCCGERWSSYNPDEIDISKHNKDGYPAKIYTHYKDYEKRWFDMYGSFLRINEPELKQESWGQEFGTKIFFETVEQYCQFMANAYGWTTPDIRIHYLDGTKKEIFKHELTT